MIVLLLVPENWREIDESAFLSVCTACHAQVLLCWGKAVEALMEEAACWGVELVLVLIWLAPNYLSKEDCPRAYHYCSKTTVIDLSAFQVNTYQ